jgi:hypothetical protein
MSKEGEMATATVRVSAVVSEEVWRRLRDLAERDRLATGRASVSAVLEKIITRELAGGRVAERVTA